MGSLFRSEQMTLCQLFLQSEAAYPCVSLLGELGVVQFRDLNPDVNVFQRKFVNEVRRCDEMERKLRFLEKEIRKDEIAMLDVVEDPEAPAPREMIDLEATFEKLENEMKEVNGNSEALKKNYLELLELKNILLKTQTFFDENEDGLVEAASRTLEDASASPTSGSNLSFVAGVIVRDRMPAFERMLWRACRGNVFLKQSEIKEALEDPTTGDFVNKVVFLIFFQGEQLKSRVKKICEGFRATLYPCPETAAERRDMAMGVRSRLDDLNVVLQQTQDHRSRVLVAAARNIKNWIIKVRKIKAIYHTLNLCNLDVTQKCLIAECWAPVSDLEQIQTALRRGTEISGSVVPSILNRMGTVHEPPTFNRTNKYTSVFQGIIDAYGVAKYREVNPAPFVIISFPFLFAVMFGDMGHGLIMFLFALYFVLREKQLQAAKIDDEIFNTFFGGRYIILLMGAFSVYTGFVYNDVFAKPVNIFGSSWTANFRNDTVHTTHDLFLNPGPNMSDFKGSPYAYGVDPVWPLSGNKITVLDSYKMKLSVILGVSQMLFGVILSVFNHTHFRQPLNIVCEFIPQILFLLCIFGYLVMLIFYKWLNFSSKDASCAPSLLIHLINMFMFTYFKKGDTKANCSSWTFYSGQRPVQIVLLLVAVLCIPVMLFAKPLVLYRRQRRSGLQRRHALSIQSEGHEDESHHASLLPEEPEEGQIEFDMGDAMVHQAIHTIEYCLGSVSHTASYLRLWALSLAHSQLSEVLWSMVLRIGFGMPHFIGGGVLFAVFVPWAVMSVAVLVLMEGLSAFLHALRLHWVEFDSKFYSGTGYAFEPFTFKNADASIDD